MEKPSIAFTIPGGYSSYSLKIGFATPEGILPFSTYSLLSNREDLTQRQRRALNAYLKKRGYKASLGETVILTHKELEAIPPVEGYLFSQHTFKNGSFVLVGFGDDFLGEPAMEIAGESAIDALVNGVENKEIRWFPERTLYAYLVNENRGMYMDWDPGVMNRIRAVRPMQSVRSLVRGMVKGAYKHHGAKSPFKSRSSKKKEPLRFEIAMSGISPAHHEMFEKDVVAAAMRELYPLPEAT